MRYKVTKEQYEMLLSARDNWPRKLNQGTQDPGCVFVYLARNANFLRSSEDIRWFDAYIYYGIPRDLSNEWIQKNDKTYLLGRIGRSRAMKKIFKKFLDNVEVITEEEFLDNLKVIPEKKGFAHSQASLDDYIEKEELALVGK